MRLSRKAAALLLLAAAAGALAAFDGSLRRAIPTRSGSALEGHPRGLADDDRVLNVVQFNMHRGEGTDGKRDLARAARCLENSDLIGLNEVDAGFLGVGASQAEELGEMLDLAWLFAPTERSWWHENVGNGVLSALPATAWKTEPMPHSGSRARRNLATVALDWDGNTVTLLVSHVDRGADRDAQLDFLAERFAQAPAPKILLADLNAERSHPVLAAWAADPALVMTTGTSDPNAAVAIDWIVAEGFTLLAASRCDAKGSDHPAVGAWLKARF